MREGHIKWFWWGWAILGAGGSIFMVSDRCNAHSTLSTGAVSRYENSSRQPQKLPWPASHVTEQKLAIEVGHSHVLTVRHARRVAVGDSQTLQANAMSASEVVVFGKHAGTTTVDVWDKAGKRYRYEVVVHAAGRMQTVETIRLLLQKVPHVQVQVEGSHLVLVGHQISALDRQLIDRVLTRFPDVIDLTDADSTDPMIMLDVVVIELPSTKLSELGVTWRAGENDAAFAGLQLTAGKRALESGGQTVGPSVNRWLGLQVEVASTVHSMMQRGEAILLAQPKLIAATGKSASFLAGGEVPYAMTDSKGHVHTEFKKYGVSVNVTPRIVGHERIVASVDIEVSAVDPTITTPVGPAMRVRKTTTQIEAHSGQPVILAGFMTSDRSQFYDGMSPETNRFWEGLTGKNSHQSRQTELAILVTPKIVLAGDPAVEDPIQRATVYAATEAAHVSRLDPRMPDSGSTMGNQWDQAMPNLAHDADDSSDEHVNHWEQFVPQIMPSQWIPDPLVHD